MGSEGLFGSRASLVTLLILGQAPAARGPGRAGQGRTDNAPMVPAPAHPKDPLHGLTLEALLTALVAAYGWSGLGERISLHCFTHEPSMKSSLKFLRKTPWAREKVESLYLFMLREARRNAAAAAQ